MTKIITDPTPEILARFAAAKVRLDKFKARQPKNNISGTVQSFVERLKQADLRLSSAESEPAFYTTDKEGRSWITPENLGKMLDAEAVKRHGNDPDIRLTECGFPAHKRDRHFLLTHDFGEQLFKIIEQLKKRKWIYAFGRVGRGKTALMTRAIWELIKKRPRSRASFVSMNDYVRGRVNREIQVNAALNKGRSPDMDTGDKPLAGLVLLDDFDKMNLGNEYNLRTILGLVERLKKENAWVLITAQFSIGELTRKYCDMDDISPLCDRLREMCFTLPKFEGRSLR
jgi:chromosomal replication initiation ATPase DnaA